MRPMAPLAERARGLNADSAWMTARTKSGLSAWALACSRINSSYTAAFVDAGLVARNDAVPALPKTRYVLAAGSRGWSEMINRPLASFHEYNCACASAGVSAQNRAARRTDLGIFPCQLSSLARWRQGATTA